MNRFFRWLWPQQFVTIHDCMEDRAARVDQAVNRLKDTLQGVTVDVESGKQGTGHTLVVTPQQDRKDRRDHPGGGAGPDMGELHAHS